MKREGRYDLLRIISVAAVIMIHVSGTWPNNAANKAAEYGVQAVFLACVYNSISRFAVPCFIMLSGAFLLDNKKNAEYKLFYFRSFAKIGVPTIVFSILYIFYRLLKCFMGTYTGISELLVLLKDILSGAPMGHMWYLYMLIWIYALTPVVIRFKESITEITFYKISIAFLILASVSCWTGTVQLHWDIGQSFEYLGYFMTGYSIRKIFKDKSNGKAFIFILSGVILELCAAWLNYKQMIGEIHNLRYGIVSPYAPLIVPASICIFIGFSLLDTKTECANTANNTFYIYLIHMGVWDFMGTVLVITLGTDFFTKLNAGIWIPVFVVTVFICSYILCKVYLWIWDKLDEEGRITNYLSKIVHLQTD